MANTSALKKVSVYVINQIALKLDINLANKSVQIGTKGKRKAFDGVSDNGKIIVKVINHSGKTSGGKKPNGKIKNTYSDCFFMNLTQAEQKILVFTNKEFYDIFIADCDGLMEDFELMYIQLPEEYSQIVEEVTKEASKEMS
ncbi:hypothetical protein [Anaerosporobacter sp.]|uniref:hypothetical protein n=1 Tax=Anaerosporobacter sp. TaxID=1872529 RepID=UPI00286F8A34|nr:hypothetical protein [Anaerosporobacter sp.]